MHPNFGYDEKIFKNIKIDIYRLHKLIKKDL